jgi:hypothetical protein
MGAARPAHQLGCPRAAGGKAISKLHARPKYQGELFHFFLLIMLFSYFLIIF